MRSRGWTVVALFAVAMLIVVVEIRTSGPREDEWADDGGAGGHFLFVAAEPMLDVRSRAAASGDDRSFPGWSEFVFGEGWASFERWGVWAVGERSAIEVALPDATARTLYLECAPYSGLADGQRVEVRVNGVEQATPELEPRMAGYRVALPEGALHAGVNEIELRYAAHVSPRAAGRGDDPRELAIGLRRIALVRASEKRLDWSPPVRRDPDSGDLVVRRSGRLVVPLPAERGGEVALRLRLRRATSADRCRVAVETLAVGGEALIVVDQTSVDGSNPDPLALRLDGGVGGAVRGLAVDVELASPGASLLVRGLRWLPAADGGGDPSPHRRAERNPAGRPPDIVVIILDAARADHVGRTYGYHRDTAPTIDRLAAESLVFTGVTSLVPYTFCSVPTMISGLSFRVHGVVRKGLRLADEAVTLAERLHDAGYRTIAFSATPNDSIRLGFDQGYDEFHELWKQMPSRAAINPFRLAKLVSERLEAGVGDGPLHLLLHFVPPHAPYQPAARFDRFSDPDYDGPVDGCDRVIRKILRHELELAPADRVELEALYDGNLLMADDAVARVLRALRRAGRWKNAVVVVTADHGEAFFEHGQQGHNTTVYEEMLRVPLVMRLPPRLRPDAVDLARLASLEDLTPTLLGLAGLEPDPRATGVDLFDQSADENERLLVLRSAETGIFALRGERFKAIMSTDGRHQELYDLVADPAERANLALREPDLSGLLALRLEAELGALEPIPPGEAEERLAGDDERALRALGYIQ